MVDDGEVLFLVGSVVLDDQAEAVGEGDRLVHAVVAVDVVLALAAVAPALADKVAAVGGSVNEDVLGARFDAALDGGFEVLVLGIGFLEREIVEEDDEALAGEVAQGVHDVGQVAELGLGELQDAQAAAVVDVGEGLDGGRLASAACADEQDVVGGLALDEGFGVVNQLLFLVRVADDVFHLHGLEVADADEALELRIPAEGFEGGDVAVAEALVVAQQGLGEIFGSAGVLEQLFECGRGLCVERHGRLVGVEQCQVEVEARWLSQEGQEQREVVQEGLLEARPDGAVVHLDGLGSEVGVVHEQVDDVAAQQVAVQADIFSCLDDFRGARPCLALVAVEHGHQRLDGRVIEQAAADQQFVQIRVFRHGNSS